MVVLITLFEELGLVLAMLCLAPCWLCCPIAVGRESLRRKVQTAGYLLGIKMRGEPRAIMLQTALFQSACLGNGGGFGFYFQPPPSLSATSAQTQMNVTNSCVSQASHLHTLRNAVCLFLSVISGKPDNAHRLCRVCSTWLTSAGCCKCC